MGRVVNSGSTSLVSISHDWEVVSNLIREVGAARDQRTAAARAAAAEGFAGWASNGGFVADREPFNLETWRYLRPLYDAVPRDPAGFDMVVMKSAQGGASTLALLWTIWLGLLGQRQLGYYLPTEAVALTFSTTRFVRLLRRNPDLHRLMGDPDDPRQRRIVNEGSGSTRPIDRSIIHFLHLGGKISTEALPLDALVFDEVQQMPLTDMEKAQERLSASLLGAILRVSTPNFEGGDIHHFFGQSDQRQFHTKCSCPEGIVLASAWDSRRGPLCIDRGNGTSPGVPTEWFFVCPNCGTIIDDPQEGEFVPHNPGVHRVGFAFSQLLSPRTSPALIREKWESRIDTKAYYNRVLGLPYTDPATQPVSLEHLRAAQRSALKWGPIPIRPDVSVAMGIDQMANDNHVVVKARYGDQMQVLWLEVVQGDDPWRRCAAIMREFHVDVCAVEASPNFNEAHRFAKAFPGKVFIVVYHELVDELVNWSDRPTEKMSARRTSEDARSPWTAIVDQYGMMAWSLGKWANYEVETPDARTLVQTIRTREGTRPVMVCQEIFWRDLRHVALVTEPLEGREDERRFRRAVKKIGHDPHFAYANLMADVAFIRDERRCQMLFLHDVDVTAPRQVSPYDQQLRDALPGLFGDSGPRLTCGTCRNRNPKTNFCAPRLLSVTPDLVECYAYDPV